MTDLVSQLSGVSPATAERFVFECGDGGNPAKRIKGAVERGPYPMTVEGEKCKYEEERGKW